MIPEAGQMSIATLRVAAFCQLNESPDEWLTAISSDFDSYIKRRLSTRTDLRSVICNRLEKSV